MRDLLRWLTHGGQEDPLPPPLVYLIPLAGGSLSILLRPVQNTQDVQRESFWFADLPDESVAQLLIQESFDKNGEGEYHGYIPGVFSIESTELDAASCHGRFVVPVPEPHLLPDGA